MSIPMELVLGPSRERPKSERCVLCVDDDYEFLKSLEFFLPEQINRNCAEGVTYRFIFLSEPLEALDVIRELVADGEMVAMLITDQQMPNMKGTEFLAQARELVPDSMRILLTGHSGIEAAIVAINERLLDKYLTKPIENEHDFMLSVKNLLDRFELQRQLERQNALIHGLYEFANTLNAAENIAATLGIVVDFTRSALPCNQVQIMLGEDDSPDTGEPPSAMALVQEAAGKEPGPDRAPPLSGLAERAEDCPGYDALASGSAPTWPVGRVAYAVLESGERVLGLLMAWEPQNGPPFSEQSLGTLIYIAASASIAIQNQMSRTRLEDIARTRARHLEEARERLQILDQLKTDFLSFVSHELRTPLNHMAAVGMIEEDMDRVDRAQMVAIVRSGYERLERFIISSLEYFEWFAPRLEACNEVTNLTALVHEVVSRNTAHHGEPVQWNVFTSPEPCLALIPRIHAERMLAVLVDNAMKFSIGPARIRLELGMAQDRVTLSIADQGQGFPPAWAAEIFRPFTVADALHHREGTALNLAKAAAMVESYGGRIRADSAGPNQGATFTVDLPAKTEGRARVVELGSRMAGPGGAGRGPGSGLDDAASEAA